MTPWLFADVRIFFAQSPLSVFKIHPHDVRHTNELRLPQTFSMSFPKGIAFLAACPLAKSANMP
jgi:hypothetical protein